MKCLSCGGEMWLCDDIYVCISCKTTVEEEKAIDVDKQEIKSNDEE